MTTQIDSDAAVEKNARTAVVFREVNEQIAGLNATWHQAGIGLFICECSDTSCAESLEITPEEYERVRANGARFLILPGHELLELERVVDGNRRFVVVEKVGLAATVARNADPRHA